MERILCKCTVWLASLALIGLMHAVAVVCAGEDKTDPADKKKMEEIIKQQEDQIKQLQSELNQLRDKGSGTTSQQQPQNKTGIVELALRDSWGGGGTDSREIRMHDSTLSIVFNHIFDLIAFFDSGAEGNARADHAIFLKSSGLERGTIEYYSGKKKLYSISGTLTEMKTTQHY